MRYYLFRNYRSNKIDSDAAKARDKKEAEAHVQPEEKPARATAKSGVAGQSLIGLSKRFEGKRQLGLTRERLRFKGGLFERPAHSILLAFWVGSHFT